MVNVDEGVEDMELLASYMAVSRCWNDYKRAVSEKMTSERAILTLKNIIEKTRSLRLRNKAEALLHKVIYDQADAGFITEAIVWE